MCVCEVAQSCSTFVTLRTAACQASLSTTNSWGSPKLMSIESVMPSNHLILCHPLLLLTSIFPSIRVFSNESVLRITWPKYWNFSFSISSVQFSCSVMSNSLRPHGLQHTRPPCPSPTPRVHSNLCPSLTSDAIQPSHPLSSPSPASKPSQHQGGFQ